MPVFKDYSRYYNLLYKEKNYNAEADYVIALINKTRPLTKSILNLGCGTGRHDFIFSEKGFHVTGVDLSQDMVDIANEQKSGRGINEVEFFQGDIRTVQLNKRFDAVISLFHVVSYQTSNQDLERTFNVAYEHLEKGGVFVFDFWYGPGVLTDRPAIRNKTFEDETFRVNRISTPRMHFNDNCVDVIFDVDVYDKATGENYDIHEVHKMRYLFLPELKYFLSRAGFTFLSAEEWVTGLELGDTSWNATVVCIKQ